MTATLACSAAYGGGGLGQHLAQLVEHTRARGELAVYYARAIDAGDDAGRAVRERLSPWIAQYTPVRFSAGWKAHVAGELFDRAVAAQLVAAEAHIGFAGQSLRTFRRARSRGCERLILVSPTAHIDHVARQHARAYAEHPIERPWLNDAQRRKTVAEYELADEILVSSAYVRESFVREGVPADKLRSFPLAVSARFGALPRRRVDRRFRVVSTGSVTVAKGTPVLLEAFSRLRDPDAELTLVGGWATRAMRRYVETWLRRDPRVRLVVGDPLPELARANVYVHPSYQDGFGFAAMEALACALPVVVTEDTGMKEHIRDGVNGYVVPTGSADAILERLEALRAATPLSIQAPWTVGLVSTSGAER